MEDEELTRARRALRGVDAELDLARVYAESRARAHGIPERLDGAEHPQDDWVPDERVVVLLHDLDTRPRRGRSRAHRGRALVWGVTAAAAAAVVVTVVNLPAPGAQPGSSPGSSPGTSLSPTDHPEPRPSPTLALTPSEVVDRAAPAVAGADCAVKTRSTLGAASATRFDSAAATDTRAPKPIPLSTQPLEVLQLATVGAALDLSGLEGRYHRLDDEFLLEEADGRTMVRIRFTPPGKQVLGGELRRIDVVVDTTTWLPYTAETWAESHDGKDYRVHSQFSWTSCAGPSSSPSPAATDDDLAPTRPGSSSR
ncbi:hypothetical protein [Promicromonospora sp. NPDC060271]|uniref:hypothetical protein n=1 Tax=Promicromonospora sp. NPDC060271 TaxID=3347089 RepID=UPI00365A8C90